MTITTEQLYQCFIRALSRTYYREIVQNTPGSGIVADAWEIVREGKDIIIRNEEFGNIVSFLEFGTKPHLIEAKDKKFLRFEKPKGEREKKPPIPGNVAFEKDGYIFTKKVQHPGIEAREFIKKILADKNIENNFSREFENELNKYI